MSDKSRSLLARAMSEYATNPKAALYVFKAFNGAPEHAVPAKTNLHIYSADAGLTIESTFDTNNQPTLSFEFAPSVAARKYDWAKKTAFMFSIPELTHLAATLLRLTPTVTYKGHGKGNSKVLQITNQPNGHYIKLIQRGTKPLSVLATPAEAALVTAKALALIQASIGQLSTADTIQVLKHCFHGYKPDYDHKKETAS